MTILYLLRSKSFGGPGQFCPLFRLNYVIFDPKGTRFFTELKKTLVCRLFFLTILGKKEVKKSKNRVKSSKKTIQNPAEI
jgi:hypothetical protein